MAHKVQTRYAVRSLVLCALFAALIAAGAFIRIPVFGIPYTLQTLFTVLAGLLLGANRGALAVGAYILIGLAGLPVFASGGGIGYVLQPTFGYILGFFFGTYATGRIAHRKGRVSAARYFWAGLAGVMIVYIVGMVYYFIIVNFYLHTGADVGYILVYCFLLTLPADVFKCAAAAILAKRLYPAVKVYLDKPGYHPYD
jgi:biotin transport system substrate-specific component